MRTPEPFPRSRSNTTSKDDTSDVMETPTGGGPNSQNPTFLSIASSVKAMAVAKRMAKMAHKGEGGLIQTGQKDKIPQRLENSYKTEPDEGCTFQTKRITDQIKKVLENSLKDKTYDEKECSELSLLTADRIKKAVVDFPMKRFKIICHVTIGQKLCQGAKMASLCLWNTSTDNYVSVPYENAHLFAVVNVYGIYFE